MPARVLEPESTRDAILRIAGQVFLAHGYEQSSMDEIALQAGVARRTLYNQFASKRALFDATMTQRWGAACQWTPSSMRRRGRVRPKTSCTPSGARSQIFGRRPKRWRFSGWCTGRVHDSQNSDKARWGDSYFDHKMNFLAHAPGLPLEIAFQTDYANRVATLAKLRELRLTHSDEIQMFCTHDHSEYISWTADRGQPDLLIRYTE